jgi:hypothetical protein
LADCQLSEPKLVRATAACHVENESEPAMIVEPHEVRRLAERMRRNWVDQGIPVNPGLSVSDMFMFIPLQDLSVWDGKFTFADWCIESAIFFMALTLPERRSRLYFGTKSELPIRSAAS